MIIAPRGDEPGPPDDFDRHQRIEWWGAWRLARAARFNAERTVRDWLATPTRADGTLMTLEEIRDEYRLVRALTCEMTFQEPGSFDKETAALIDRRQHDLTSPGHWLWAAKEIAKQHEQRIAERRKVARARW